MTVGSLEKKGSVFEAVMALALSCPWWWRCCIVDDAGNFYGRGGVVVVLLMVAVECSG